ncbi:hypothetical protein ILYODFUR_039154 [Ilyodon furcidens]|uniref:Uncharacterized protein n=1 Tax=Ilyodon furcidens TaxID=33524 RepID=A0ABV0TES4_9TELE
MTSLCQKKKLWATSKPVSAAPTLPSCKYSLLQKCISDTESAPESADALLFLFHIQAEYSGRPSAVCQNFSHLGEGAHQLPGDQKCSGRKLQHVNGPIIYP